MTCRTSRAGRGDKRRGAAGRFDGGRQCLKTGPTGRRRLRAAIFDVDGVLVASPHERAWREALAGYADPARFTTEFYQANVAGKPRQDGARSTLEGLGVPQAAARAPEYAAKKQALIDRLIAEGSFEAFPDAVRFASALARGRLAAGTGLLVEERRSDAAPPDAARRTHTVVDLRCRPERHGRAAWQAGSCAIPTGGPGSERATRRSVWWSRMRPPASGPRAPAAWLR